MYFRSLLTLRTVPVAMRQLRSFNRKHSGPSWLFVKKTFSTRNNVRFSSNLCIGTNDEQDDGSENLSFFQFSTYSHPEKSYQFRIDFRNGNSRHFYHPSTTGHNLRNASISQSVPVMNYHRNSSHNILRLSINSNSDEDDIKKSSETRHQTAKIKAEFKKEVKSVDSLTNSWLMYLNPINLTMKIGSLVWRFLFATVDSIIHPRNGKQRLLSMKNKIVEEAKHYKEGASLMATDIKEGWKIIRKLVKGKEITFRERRQLRRVSLDLLRIIPMIVIVLIPFLEVCLPVLLVLFPNLLPSRFQSEYHKTAKRKRLLQARLQMIGFWEDTLERFVADNRAKQMNDASFDKLEDILVQIKNKQQITNENLLKVARLFDDEITLDNATPTELSNMCRYMALNTFGTPAILRARLKSQVRKIRKEDQGIQTEGVDSLPVPLLKQLLRERGMRADIDEWLLRKNLKKWLELSLNDKIPLMLLVMSRIFTIQHVPGEEPTQLLKDTLSNIGAAATEAMLVDKAGVVDPQIEKKVIKRQRELIAEEEQLQEATSDILTQFEEELEMTNALVILTPNPVFHG